MPRGDNKRIKDADPRLTAVFRLAAKGRPLGEIVRVSGMSRHAVARVLGEEGIEVRVRRRGRPPEGIEFRTEAFVSGTGGHASDMADKAGVHRSTVSRRMAKAGTPVRELKRMWWERVERIVARLVARGRTEKAACLRCKVDYNRYKKRMERKSRACIAQV